MGLLNTSDTVTVNISAVGELIAASHPAMAALNKGAAALPAGRPKFLGTAALGDLPDAALDP